MTLLEVDGLGVEVKRYGKWVPVIDDVSFAIEEGETLGLVGESGSGKTLTASAVMNLLPPSVRRAAGSVTFEGRVVSTLSQRDFRPTRGRCVLCHGAVAGTGCVLHWRKDAMELGGIDGIAPGIGTGCRNAFFQTQHSMIFVV